MKWVLKRTVSMRGFFSAAQTYVQTDGLENISNSMLKKFVYLNLSYTAPDRELLPNIFLCLGWG